MPETRCPHGGDPGACQICAGTTNVMCIHGGDPGACQLCNMPPVSNPRPPTPNELSGAPSTRDPFGGRDPSTSRNPSDGPPSQHPSRRRNVPGYDWDEYKNDAYKTNAQRKHFFSPKKFMGRVFGGNTCQVCGEGPGGDKHV